MMIREHTIFRAGFPALLENADLLCDVAEFANHLFVTIVEGEDGIGDASVAAKVEHQALGPTQIVPRNAGVEMMDGLELKTTVEEVEPGRAVDIHGGAEHSLRERLVDSHIGGGHGEVRKRDLHVQRRGNHVRDEKEGKPAAPVRNRAVHHSIAKPDPEKDLTANLKPPMPPGGTFLRGLAREKVFPAQTIQVETSKQEDGVVKVVLKAQEEVCSSIEFHDAVVVGAAKAGKEAMGNGEEWHVFDIRVVFGGVRHDMVDIVAAFPPPQAESSEIVGDNDTNHRVDVEVVRNAHMASIMGSKHKLMPKASKEET